MSFSFAGIGQQNRNWGRKNETAAQLSFPWQPDDQAG